MKWPLLVSAVILWTANLAQGQSKLPSIPDAVPYPIIDNAGDSILLPPLVVRPDSFTAQEKDSPPKKNAPVSPENGGAVLGDNLYQPFDWTNFPPVRPVTRPGAFSIRPTGPGYYSLLDFILGNYRETAPKFPYSPFIIMAHSFYDADFRYLDSPDNKQFDFFDFLHHRHLGDNFLINTGGQFWYRGIQEINSRLTGKENDYGLYRIRPYIDVWYQDKFRIFAEGIYADRNGGSLPAAPTDVNRGDFQNLFGEMKLFGLNDHNAYLRVGRQEIYLGSQRLVSALDWANTRRTFDGVRAYRQGEKFDVDLFWLRPVIPNSDGLSSSDDRQSFGGLWTTYRPQKGYFFDLYYLYHDNQNSVSKLKLRPFPLHDNTLGTRYTGDYNNWLWDVELMFQFGEHLAQTDIAGASVVGMGYHFKNQPMNPLLWFYYDYASGTRNPSTTATFSTFDQLFPFGHPYLGFMDLVGRQNIHDPNVQLFLHPLKWVTLWSTYHHFFLDSATDALYSAGGAIERRDPTGKAGHNVGDELDFWFSFHLTAHSDFSLGWSRLYAGSFLKHTGSGQSPEQAYFIYSFRW